MPTQLDVCLAQPTPPPRTDLPRPPQFAHALLTSPHWARWQGEAPTLHIRFLDGHPYIHDAVKQVARTWTDYADIHFRFADELGTQPDLYEIRISFAGLGANSYVGVQALDIPQDQKTMNLQIDPTTNETVFRRTVLHEFGHALGLVHEHQNPAKGIPWNKAAVYDYYEDTYGWPAKMVDDNVFAYYEVDHVYASEFDPQSIMLYAIPPQLTHDGHSVDWNNELSEFDKKHIAALYAPD